MKIFTKKGITQKIILLITIAILWNFVFPTFSRADVGGLLFDPIANLVMSVGDVIVAAFQMFFYDGSFLGTIGSIFSDYTTIPDMQYTGDNPVNIDADRLGNLWDSIWSALGGDKYSIPTIQYSVDKIFAGKVPAFDINFINPSMYSGHGAGSDVHIASQINGTISKWYVALRNLSVVILLSVLVYTGIRIVISSSADDRAKYKQRVFDWVVAMCLIFFMHYIMLFTISMVDILNDTIGETATSIPVNISDGTQFNTSLMGLVRLQAQYSDFASKVTFMIFYIALVVYTVKFSWVYLKRLITMMFLTIIAPLVAMTYPIDRMNDGKSQAFNAWLKEYIYTALLQPFHLIVYTVLVGSAIEVVKANPLYAIMVIAFIGPAEKMLRKFFGFDNASTPGMLSQAGAMFGGAAAMNMLKKGAGLIANKGNGGKGGNGGGNNTVRTRGGNAVEDQNAPSGYDAFAGRNNSNGNDENGESPEQRMLDAYDENYGTDEWDPQERDALARDAYANQNQGADYSADEYAQLLRDTGYDEDEIRQMVNESYGEQNDNAEPEPAPEQTNRGGFMRKAGAIAAAPFKGIGKSLKNTYNRNYAGGRWKRTLGNGALKIGKGALKFAGKAAVAGTVGAIGVGMGIAGNDLDDVLKYGAAGTALGYSMAPGIGRKIANTDVARSISTEMGRAIYGDDNSAALARQERALRDSGELRDWAQDTFLDDNGNKRNGKELNELEDRAIGHYNDGFTDKGDIKKVMKLEDKMRKELVNSLPEQERDSAENIEQTNEKARVMSETIGKIAKDIEPGKLSNTKYVDGKIDEFTKGISKSNPSLSKREAKENATQMMDYVKQYYKKP